MTFSIDSDIEDSPRRASPPAGARDRPPRTPRSRSRLATPGKPGDAAARGAGAGGRAAVGAAASGSPTPVICLDESSPGAQAAPAKKPAVLKRLRKGEGAPPKSRKGKGAAAACKPAATEDAPAQAGAGAGCARGPADGEAAIDLDALEDEPAPTPTRQGSRQGRRGGKAAGAPRRDAAGGAASPEPDVVCLEPEPGPAAARGRRKRAAKRAASSAESAGDSDFDPSSSSEEEAPRPGRRRARPRGGSQSPPAAGGEFFMTAAQKKRRRAQAEAQAALHSHARAVEQLQAEKRQRQEDRAAFRGDKKDNPFFKPRPAAAAAPEARAGGAAPAVKEPAQPLPPPLPPIHVTQDGGAAPRDQLSWDAWQLTQEHSHSHKALLEAAVAEAAAGQSVLLWPDQAGRTAADSAAAWPLEAAEPLLPTDEADDALWTERYRPASATAVCGNRAAAAELLAWLRDWRPGRPAAARPAEASDSSESDGEWLQRGVGRKAYREWSSDEEEGATALEPGHSAAWLSGPTGCGKSAAVSAVAQELGLRILEVNPGSQRTGAGVLRSIGEATQSSRLPVASEALLARHPASADGGGPAGGATLLVFEEVDSLLEEDKGFLAALAGLVQDSKRPIVMTSTSAEPPPPLAGLRMLRLVLQPPTPRQAAGCVAAILAAEGRALARAPWPGADGAVDLRRAILQAQLEAPRGRPADQAAPQAGASSSGWWEAEQGAAPDALHLLAEAEDRLSALERLSRAQEEVVGCVMHDDWEWQEDLSASATVPLPDSFEDVSAGLLHATARGHILPSPGLMDTHNPGGNAAAHLAAVLAGSLPQRAAAPAAERAGVGWAVARMAAAEAGAREEAELRPRSPRRGGRRRRLRWHLADDSGLSAAALEAAAALHAGASFAAG